MTGVTITKQCLADGSHLDFEAPFWDKLTGVPLAVAALHFAEV